MPMLDDTRRAAIETIIGCLPLTDQQRELATETVADLTDDDADLIIESHARLVDSLPSALAAIRMVAQGTQTKRAGR